MAGSAGNRKGCAARGRFGRGWSNFGPNVSAMITPYHGGDSPVRGNRTRSQTGYSGATEMITFIRVFAVLIGLVFLGAVGLYIYGQGIQAPVAPVEKVLPDEQFPR